MEQYVGEEQKQRKVLRKHCLLTAKRNQNQTLSKVAKIYGDPPKPKPERDPEPGPDTRSASQPPDSQS